jgi:RimJ/RimL family protein N-acetyltransferase
MPAMTDPSDALASFQQVLPSGVLELQPCALDPKLFVHMDEPAPGVTRLTYVRMAGQTVTAMALFTPCEAIEGRTCFAVGYAVPPAYRGQGRAKDVVTAALRELEKGFGRAGILPIYVEAIVGADNVASQRVASATISAESKSVTDSFSGVPALQYVRKIG